MTAKNITDLKAAIAANIEDNTTAEITPADVRTQMTNIVDSMSVVLTRVVAPGIADDSAHGCVVGTVWIDTVTGTAYRCVDASVGAAVWKTFEVEGAVATHAALTTGVHGLAITSGQTLTVVTGGTLASGAYAAATSDLLATGATVGASAQSQVFTNGVTLSDLTATRIPYVSTAGKIISDASLVYSTVTGLTTTKPITAPRIDAPAPHVTVSSSLIQGVVSATVAYPIMFENLDDILDVYQAAHSFTVNNSGVANCTITCPVDHLLTAGAAVMFHPLTGGTGITVSTPYFVSATNLTARTFELSTTTNGVSNVKTTATGSGTVTCISRLYIATPGDYLFNLSAVVDTTDNSTATMDVWFVIGNSTDNHGGTPVVRSNTQIGIDSNGTQQVVAVPIILDLAAGDYVRLDYRGSTNKIRWLSIAAQTNPVRPEMPSVIITANRVCA